MSIRNQNWYNLQATRSYPLDEKSTGEDDAGAFIRNDILVDCHIKFPQAVGTYLYVQGLTVSSGLVTVVFGVSANSTTTPGHTLATVTVPQPVEPYVNYPINGLVPGVSGWVVFGPGVDTNFAGRYSAPIQTLLQTRSARPYRALPIPSLKKINVAEALSGVVTLAASTPVTATYSRLNTGDNVTRPAVIFSLDSSQITPEYNPLTEFLGPCGQRPESGTCPKTPIESINGIQPDCDGNITIAFDGFSALPFTDCGGMDVLTDTSLAAVCNANKPKTTPEYSDDCCDPNSPVFDGQDEYCWPDPTTAIDQIVDETVIAADYPCLNLPLCIDFSSCTISPYFETRAGRFNSVQIAAPPVCPCGEQDPNAPEPAKLTDHNVYAVLGTGSLNIAVLKNCPTDWTYGRTISVETQIGRKGLTRNAGLILNYKQELVVNSIATTYIVALIDVTQEKFRVLRYNNSQFIEEISVNFPAQLNTWYKIALNPALAAPVNDVYTTVDLNFSVTQINPTAADTQVVIGSVPMSIANFGQGLAGIFANRAYALFNKFIVT